MRFVLHTYLFTNLFFYKLLYISLLRIVQILTYYCYGYVSKSRKLPCFSEKPDEIIATKCGIMITFRCFEKLLLLYNLLGNQYF